MTNLAHWQDDIEEALGGDFDGSLSGLCIMSLSFDFTRNGNGTLLGSNSNVTSSGTGQLAGGALGTTVPLGNKSTSCGTNSNYDTRDYSNGSCFKRFKPSNAVDPDSFEDENRSSNQQKFVRQLQQLKNCLNSNNAKSMTTNATQAQYHNSSDTQNGVQLANENILDRSSPQSTETSCKSTPALSSPNGSPRSSVVDVRSSPSSSNSPSPSPSQRSCSSVFSRSHASSRSPSPSDMSVHGSNNNANANPNAQDSGRTELDSSGSKTNQHEQRSNENNDNQQVSIYSFKDSLLNGSKLKESSYTTSVITTTAPMHFKNLHHPFSLKQFPLSPYHQFSNSSLNHDFYDRYMSHDSHQPLQTPLIGIERTQDLLSLKLPPHGSDDTELQKFPREWPFDDHSKSDANTTKSGIKETPDKQTALNGLNGINRDNNRKKEQSVGLGSQKGFSFNYKSGSSVRSDSVVDHGAPIDLNVSYEQNECCSDGRKNSIFDESMKHFNPDRAQQDACYDLRSKNASPIHNSNPINDAENVNNISHQCHGQESMFGIDPGKQKFHYVLAAPISVATKLTEDTMTYLNQGQAYEIKLENFTDVSEAKKGFMCSIINIGFQERHMQQAENELWQQWSQQHPNEKIFSVDMKLSYNVFGVESDGLNKYEFLWDSSKAAGVFIRINSISTEFTPKKHGGEKGVPFKLSIETFSYNSKTHDSYFISAACCQIKIFKPKGAERKIRSDRDKILKRPPIEQEKYHRSCDHTGFKECSLISLHPMADDSLCYYRHSHGHFASKQVIAASSVGGTPSVQNQQSTTHEAASEIEHADESPQPDNRSPGQGSSGSQLNNESESSNTGPTNGRQEYQDQSSRSMIPVGKSGQSEYSVGRPLQHGHQYGRVGLDHAGQIDHDYGSHQTGESSLGNPSELFQSNAFNQMYHTNQARGVASLAGVSNPQHFGVAYYGHGLPAAIPAHIPTASAYGIQTGSSLTSLNPSNGMSISPNPHIGTKVAPSIYRHLGSGKHMSVGSASHSAPFKASNLALSSHNNFPTHLGNHGEQCTENHIHEPKDGSMTNELYHHEPYDSHFHHSFPPTTSSGHQQHPRQRSASISLATANGHCVSSYANHNRHLEGYAGSNSITSDNTMNGPHWNHGHAGNSQAVIPNPNCVLRSGLSSQSHESAYSNNYDCNNQHYDSDRSSPHKNHLNTSNSSSTCYSRFKNTSALTACGLPQEQYDNLRLNTSVPNINLNSDCTEVVSWFAANRFALYAKTFSNFSGSDLLRLSKTELIEICGLIDGIRLYNSLHNQPIKPRRVLYVCHEESEVFHPIYLYEASLGELVRELSNVFQSCLKNAELPPDDKHQKNETKRLSIGLKSSSGSISRPNPALLNESGPDDLYPRNQFYGDLDGSEKHLASDVKAVKGDAPQSTRMIDRLLVDGVAVVKIIATEQMVQMLEDESVWTISFATKNSGLIEACIASCHTKRTAK